MPENAIKHSKNGHILAFRDRRKSMIKVLFICHGNICRSPMAEFVMKKIVRENSLAENFEIASAATSTEEIGNPVYPPVRSLLNRNGINCDGKTARQLTKGDYQYYDYLIGMDRANFRNMNRMCGGDPEGKINLLLDYTNRPGDIADPWYTGNFDETYEDVVEGLEGFMEYLKENGEI